MCLSGKRGQRGVATFIEFVDPIGRTKKSVRYLQLLLNTGMSLALIVPIDNIDRCMDIVKNENIPENYYLGRTYYKFVEK